jgi:molybdopterin-biosynthesis enzyme MoeA-like protein
MIRVEMIPDDIDDIVATLHRLRERLGPRGAIFTSGGIGPTHDDVTHFPRLARLLSWHMSIMQLLMSMVGVSSQVTYEAIAKATGTTLALHEPTVDKVIPNSGMSPRDN